MDSHCNKGGGGGADIAKINDLVKITFMCLCFEFFTFDTVFSVLACRKFYSPSPHTPGALK